MKLSGRSAIITGASRGLGAEIARQFVAAGASVFLCARNGDELERVLADVAPRLAPDARAEGMACDVADFSAFDRLVERAAGVLPRIDILVNNAGVYGPFGLIENVDWLEWIAALNINLLGTVYPCRAVLPIMKRQRYGKIINLSGGGATNPMPRVSCYAASKAAVVRFTESLAQEVRGDGIDVNAVAPGALATRLLDQIIAAGPEQVGADLHARMMKIQGSGGTPLEKGAALCVYLASANSDGITGRLLSAVWDPWPSLHQRRAELADSDIYTLRRIVPEDRGKSWSG